MYNFKLSNFLQRFVSNSAKKSSFSDRVTQLSLAAVLGLAGVSWIAIDAIAPQVAQAYTARLDVELNRQQDETYQTMLRRAEAVARAAAQRAFDSDILVTDVAVTIMGQNEGAIAPILRLNVSRQSWREQPDPQLWATYFPNVESLLKFEDLAVNGAENQGVEDTESGNAPISQPGLPTSPSPNSTTGNNPTSPNSQPTPTTTTGNSPTPPNSQPTPSTTTGNTDLTPPSSTNQPNNNDPVNPNRETVPTLPTNP